MNALRLIFAILIVLAAAPGDAVTRSGIYLGADLSSINEVEDCGGKFHLNRKLVDPVRLLKAEGGNLVRVRLWNQPSGRYSGLKDVEETIRRSRAAGLHVLLDFHYADTWADGDKQPIPKAWVGLSTPDQAKALYDYTRQVLATLKAQGLLPDMVQVGNETNSEMLGGKKGQPIDWARNALLLNSGIAAVHDASQAFGKPIRIMLHIAQPENVIPWFDAATAAGVRGYDLIGISYYSKWSTRSIPQLGATIAEARARYKVDVMLVETAYPFTTDSADGVHHLLGPDTLIQGYPATPAGQLHYLRAITNTVVGAGGIGVVWWEPAFISTRCMKSPWENATWFDFRRNEEALPAFSFLRGNHLTHAPAH